MSIIEYPGIRREREANGAECNYIAAMHHDTNFYGLGEQAAYQPIKEGHEDRRQG